MNETFKINVLFDEKGEEIEELIARIVVNTLQKNSYSSIEGRKNV